MNSQPTVAEQIVSWLVDQGIDRGFSVTGGGAMFLNQAFGTNPGFHSVYMHHEQACAMAAEGYARLAEKPAVVNVTTGPGGINALNGVFGAYTDSIPMLVISGQVKRETCLAFHDLPDLRQLGDQEAPIAELAAPVTKLCTLIREPEDLEDQLPRAVEVTASGRPGPVWLDIPIDIQAARVPLVFRSVVSDQLPGSDSTLIVSISGVLEELRKRHRPLILAGTGVRLARAEAALLRLVEKLGIPLATAWTHDLIPSDHPLFAGRPGTIGTRSGNLIAQQADFVLVLGSRLNIRQTSYNWQRFCPSAFVVQVDIDPAELEKPTFQPHLGIISDAGEFVRKLAAHHSADDLPDYAPWAAWCRNIRQRFPLMSESMRRDSPLNPYRLVDFVFERLHASDILVCGNASACIIPFQVGRLQAGQRMFSNSGSASMGYDLPAAIGAAIAAPERRVICIAGDGSLQMNVQELQTLKTLDLPIIVLVLANGGYLSIRQTHENFFQRVVGATPASGVDFPSFCDVGQAYGIRSLIIQSPQDMSALAEVLDSVRGPILCEVTVDQAQEFEPRVRSRVMADGRFSSPELDDMYPFLDPEELARIRDEGSSIRSIPKRGLDQ